MFVSSKLEPVQTKVIFGHNSLIRLTFPYGVSHGLASSRLLVGVTTGLNLKATLAIHSTESQVVLTNLSSHNTRQVSAVAGGKEAQVTSRARKAESQANSPEKKTTQ